MLQAFPGEGRNKAFLGGLANLTKTIFDTDCICEGEESFIFLIRDLSVYVLECRVRRDAWHRRILVHDADEYVIAKGVMKPAKHAL